MTPISVYETPGSSLISPPKTGGIFPNTAILCLWDYREISKGWQVETEPTATLQLWLHVQMYVSVCLRVYVNAGINHTDFCLDSQEECRSLFPSKKKVNVGISWNGPVSGPTELNCVCVCVKGDFIFLNLKNTPIIH